MFMHTTTLRCLFDGRSQEAAMKHVTRARVTHFTVMMVLHTFTLRRIPDAPFADAVWDAIPMHHAEVRLLGLLCLYPATEAPFSASMWGRKNEGLPQSSSHSWFDSWSSCSVSSSFVPQS